MRKVPMKNYFILILLLLITVGVVFFIKDIYQSHDDKKYVSIMNCFITEVKLDDLTDYTLENSPVVIFISDKNNSSLSVSENKYKDLLAEYDLQSLFVYLNVSNNKEDILKKFNEKYQINLDDKALPIIVVIDEGRAVDLYSKEQFNKPEVINFLTENGVIESD